MRSWADLITFTSESEFCAGSQQHREIAAERFHQAQLRAAEETLRVAHEARRRQIVGDIVPLLIAPAYFGCGYLAWSLAHVFVGVFGNKLRAEQIWRVPLVAVFVMVMWDLTMDPIAATVQKQWIWHDGGSYFGVPLCQLSGLAALCLHDLPAFCDLHLPLERCLGTGRAI
jgi:hypothetical protein